MFRTLPCIPRVLVVLAAICSASVAIAAEEQAETSDDDIAALVEQVTEGSAGERREATDQLLKLGERAVVPLSVAAETEVKENANACFDVLARLRASSEEKTAEAAKKSLERLSESDIPNVARRAKTALRLNTFLRQQGAAAAPPGPNAVPRIQFGGVGGKNQSVQIATDANGRRRIQVQDGDEQIEINDSAGKDIRVKHTRPVAGQPKTDEYKAADLDELKKKHPDIAKLYEKHARGNLVVGGGGALAVQIQVGGPAAPVPVRGAPVPVPGPFFPFPREGDDNHSTGKRTIRAELDGRKIEINDDEGKKIRVKLTKVVDGKESSQEFAADDLKTLASEHPEAAKLYEQLTGRKLE